MATHGADEMYSGAVQFCARGGESPPVALVSDLFSDDSDLALKNHAPLL
jgi:hypothetical protein